MLDLILSEAHLQKICSGFLACEDAFKAAVPAAYAAKSVVEITKSLLA